MICIGDNKIQIWRTHHWTESILQLRLEWTKFLVNHNNGAVAVTGPTDIEHTVRVGRDRSDEWRFGVCCIECQMSQVRAHCRTLLTRRDNSRQFHETRQGIRMTAWVNVNHPSKRRRNRHVYHFPHVESRSQMRQRQTGCMDEYTMHSTR